MIYGLPNRAGLFFQEINMDNNYGIQDLYKGYLLAGPHTTLNGQLYQENEIILEFDNIQRIAFGEDINSVSARGGYLNPQLINWESARNIYGAIDMGRVSPNGFALISRSNINSTEDGVKSIPHSERVYVGDDGILKLQYEMNTSYPLRVWLLKQGIKSSEIVDYEIEDNTIILEDTNIDVLVTYWYDVEINYQSVDIGAKDFNGYLKFIGKFYYTDENTSNRKTAIIEIPRLQIQSNFNLNFGRNTSPLISVLQFAVIPEGPRQKRKTISITYLDDDIDADADI